MPNFETPESTESHAEAQPSHDEKNNEARFASLADRVRNALVIPDKLSSPEASVVWKPLDRDHAFDPEGFYRIVNQNGYDDFVKSGVVRSDQGDYSPSSIGKITLGGRPTSFPSFAKGKPDLTYAKEGEDNYIFESNLPMYKRGEQNPATGNKITGRHWAYRSIDPVTGEDVLELSAEKIKNIYKIDKKGSLFQKG